MLLRTAMTVSLGSTSKKFVASIGARLTTEAASFLIRSLESALSMVGFSSSFVGGDICNTLLIYGVKIAGMAG